MLFHSLLHYVKKESSRIISLKKTIIFIKTKIYMFSNMLSYMFSNMLSSPFTNLIYNLSKQMVC